MVGPDNEPSRDTIPGNEGRHIHVQLPCGADREVNECNFARSEFRWGDEIVG